MRVSLSLPFLYVASGELDRSVLGAILAQALEASQASALTADT